MKKLLCLGILLGVFSINLLGSSHVSAWAPVTTAPYDTEVLTGFLDDRLGSTPLSNWRDYNRATVNYDSGSFITFFWATPPNSPNGGITDGGTGQTQMNGLLCRWNNGLGAFGHAGCNSYTTSYGLATSEVYEVFLTDEYIEWAETNNPDVLVEYSDLLETREEWDFTPRLNVLTGVDNKVTIQDMNFNTFDEVPFTCNEGLAPVIQYELKDESLAVIDSGTMSPTTQYVYQHTRELAERTFTFTANYYCGDTSEDPLFPSSSTVEYTLTQGGTLKNDIFASCMNSEFPYLHFDACTENIETALNMLSFGSVKLGNEWTSNDGCTELNVLGDWLNVPDNTVCPFFSSTIRNVVTPFVTLLLGLVTLNFIFKIGNTANG